jgi:hypothetical protein
MRNPKTGELFNIESTWVQPQEFIKTGNILQDLANHRANRVKNKLTLAEHNAIQNAKFEAAHPPEPKENYLSVQVDDYLHIKLYKNEEDGTLTPRARLYFIDDGNEKGRPLHGYRSRSDFNCNITKVTNSYKVWKQLHEAWVDRWVISHRVHDDLEMGSIHCIAHEKGAIKNQIHNVYLTIWKELGKNIEGRLVIDDQYDDLVFDNETKKFFRSNLKN